MPVPRTVSFDNVGLTLIHPKAMVQLNWQQIGAVYAYKRDCWTVDQICVALVDETRQISIDVGEDDKGYPELIAHLPDHLPGCLAVVEWWFGVAFPPFETQLTRLYTREVTTTSPGNESRPDDPYPSIQ